MEKQKVIDDITKQIDSIYENLNYSDPYYQLIDAVKSSLPHLEDKEEHEHFIKGDLEDLLCVKYTSRGNFEEVSVLASYETEDQQRGLRKYVATKVCGEILKGAIYEIDEKNSKERQIFRVNF